MIDFYLAGVVAAVLIGVVKSCVSLFQLSSIRTKNFERVDLHFSVWLGDYTDEKSGCWSIAGYFFLVLFLAPVASWISVAFATCAWWLSRQAPPAELKSLQYRVAHVALTREQMIEWQEQSAKALSLAGPVRRGRGTGNSDTLVLEPGEWREELRMRPDKFQFEFYGRISESARTRHATYEYRFEGDKMMMRMIERYIDECGRRDWSVQDGAILEADIRSRLGETWRAKADETIAGYQNEVQWQEVRALRVRVFAMTMHPSMFSHLHILEFVRAEVRRMRIAVESVVREATKSRYEVQETDEGVQFCWGQEWTDGDKQRMDEVLADQVKRAGTSFDELKSYKKSRAELLAILGEDPSG